jgi:ABC-2 type transport system permease protein
LKQIMLLIWKALYKDDSSSYAYMLNYSIIAQILNAIYISHYSNDMLNKIMSGAISVELVRPWNYITSIFFKDLGVIIVNITVTVLPLVLISKIFLHMYTPISIYVVLFFISIFFSILILFLLKMIVSMLSFWFLETWSFIVLFDILVRFFSGQFLPDWIMPVFLKRVMNVLPFIWTYQKPIEIYLAKYKNAHTSIYSFMHPILLQLIWVVVLVVIVALIWNKAVSKLVVQGG